jgi:pyruvate kinase
MPMVARGDLGVELPAMKYRLFKRINPAKQNGSNSCNCSHSNDGNDDTSLTPTRAEVNDVATLLWMVLMVMLSGETATGNYPVQVIRK